MVYLKGNNGLCRKKIKKNNTPKVGKWVGWRAGGVTLEIGRVKSTFLAQNVGNMYALIPVNFIHEKKQRAHSSLDDNANK